MKKVVLGLFIILVITGCSTPDKMTCTLKKDGMTNVLNMDFEEGKLVKTSTKYTLILGNATEEDANNTLEDTKAQYISDGFTNVKATLNNHNKVLVVDADVDLEDFIKLNKYQDIKKYYEKMNYECK